MDFVMPWVDGNDPIWQESKNSFATKGQGDSCSARFRDWEILKYWFRGVEKFAPWVDRIHFITCGHTPAWLNLDHPKLHFVKHSDYIPADCLPTFNSHTIEHNIYRIEGLSEQFVYFNDDMHIIAPMKESDFFINGLPCDAANMAYKIPSLASLVQSVDYNNIYTINCHFKKFKEIKKHPGTFFNPAYGIYSNLYALYTMPAPVFPGFYNYHTAQPFLKSTFEAVWEKEKDRLNKTCNDKFRDYSHLNQWVYRYWQFAEGKIHPVSFKGKRERIEICDDSIQNIQKTLEEGKVQILCLNDDPKIPEASFMPLKMQVIESFEKLFPKKSSFEK